MTETQKQIHYWKGSAKRDWGTAQALFDLKRYDACLFFCHLTLEKLLKGLVVRKTKKSAPFIHDLEKLARRLDLDLSPERIEHLRTFTTFNVSGRYDNEKYEFHKKCTKSFTRTHLDICKSLHLWLLREYRKN